MLCKYPFVKEGQLFGCKQCMSCRINDRRVWAHRMMLESCVHGDSSFVTLTYDEKHLPANGSLRIRDYQLFLKSLRKALAPKKLRYFIVGEYGDQTQRPHYHAALFGVSMLLADTVQKCWGKGYTHVGDLTWDSAQYIAGYVTKKMTSEDDPRLQGRHPEFARMSLKPGIGAAAMEAVAMSLQTDHGMELVGTVGDVPSSLSHGQKQRPLGRYLKSVLRRKCGSEEEFKKSARTNFAVQMQELREAFKRSEEGSEVYQDRYVKDEVFKNWVSRENEQRRLNQASRWKIRNRRGRI